jgi:hypothetical protein
MKKRRTFRNKFQNVRVQNRGGKRKEPGLSHWEEVDRKWTKLHCIIKQKTTVMAVKALVPISGFRLFCFWKGISACEYEHFTEV